MTRPKECIICNEKAKSAEHIFPASLGGRRTNKGIYCNFHNNHFGSLVARLEKQLAMMNALLEIRPDRKNEPKPYLFKDDDTGYQLLGREVSVELPPPFDPSQVDLNGDFLLRAPSEESAKRWVEENSQDGLQFKISKIGDVQSHYQTNKHKIELHFGGGDFMQAVAYLALTFFSHSFPNEARQSGLAPMKTFLLESFNDELTQFPSDIVWWDGREPRDVVGENPYDFGHAVLVGISDTSSHAYVYISFFSCLNFGIDLGRVEPQREVRSVKSFIDPTSDSARDSVTELKSDHFASVLGENTVTLHNMIHSGSAANALNHFFNKVEDRHVSLAMTNIQEELSNTTGDDFSVFQGIVHKQRQVVFNLLSEVVKGLCLNFSSHPEIQKILSLMVLANPDRSDGLEELASMTIQLNLEFFAHELMLMHSRNKASLENLRRLFYGDVGCKIIVENINRSIVPMLK